jgi:HAD superfamily hydrolase (TIGR01484 family)
MQPLYAFGLKERKKIKFVLTDIDDTLTLNQRLPEVAYTAMEKLWISGIKVIPITGRPGGWCDHMARMWPIDGIVGENGAFYFHYLQEKRKMARRYWKPLQQRQNDHIVLKAIEKRILNECPGARVSSDQTYREADLAIDYCEDVVPMSMSEVEKIVSIFEEMGAQAKVSSIHVNGWIGDYDKLSMTRVFFQEIFQKDLENIKEQIVFVGDSPNDAPMFKYFPNSIGVSNVKKFLENLAFKPTWITKKEGGLGFAEVAEALLENTSVV